MLRTQPNLAFTENRVRLADHTDACVITLLCNVLNGLQIISAGQPNEYFNWQYIKTGPGYALVDLSGTLVE